MLTSCPGSFDSSGRVRANPGERLVPAEGRCVVAQCGEGGPTKQENPVGQTPAPDELRLDAHADAAQTTTFTPRMQDPGTSPGLTRRTACRPTSPT